MTSSSASTDDSRARARGRDSHAVRGRRHLNEATDHRVEAHEADTLEYADLVLDLAGHEASRGELRLELTRTEYALLELLMRNAGTVLSRDVIMDRVWGYELEPASNSLEVFIGYLRRKTEVGGAPRLIHTVRGIGYVLRAD